MNPASPLLLRGETLRPTQAADVRDGDVLLLEFIGRVVVREFWAGWDDHVSLHLTCGDAVRLPCGKMVDRVVLG